MTNLQQTEIEVILTLLSKKQTSLSKSIKNIEKSIINNYPLYTTTTTIEATQALVREVGTILNTLDILNNDNKLN